jgi:hypothetical protein
MCKLCMLYSGSAQAPAEPSSVPSDARQAAAQPTENGTAAVHTGEQAGTEIATTSPADGQAVADGANTPAKDQLSSPNLAASKGQVMPACSLCSTVVLQSGDLSKECMSPLRLPT